LAGDEFLIVLTDVKDIPDAAVAAERFMDAITAEFVVQGHPLNVSCSLGISIFPEHGQDGETLIKHADAAMYSAKDYGRDSFRFFTADMNAQAVERLTLENSLRLAPRPAGTVSRVSTADGYGHGKGHRVGGSSPLATPGIGACAA
jgi:predicted signal transduction protein with EAL and GGDEF domain